MIQRFKDWRERRRKKKALQKFPHDGVNRRISTETAHRLMRSMLDGKRVATAGPRWGVIIVVSVVAVFVVVGILIQMMG